MSLVDSFKSGVEAHVADQLLVETKWVPVKKLSGSNVVGKTDLLQFDHDLGGKKLTLAYSLVGGVNVYELLYEGVKWVVTNPAVIAFVKNLIEKWIAEHSADFAAPTTANT